MSKGNHTGKGGFGDRPQDRYKGGSQPKGARLAANSFKEMVLRYASDEPGFKVWAKNNPTELYKLAGQLCPKEIDVTPVGKFILICDDETTIVRKSD
jgi:hypothetical protein